MIVTSVDVVEGWTGALDFQLKANDETPATPMGGSATVTLILRDRKGNLVDVAGDCEVLDRAQWTVRYTPDSADLVAANGPCSGRWRVEDGAVVVFFPSGEADVWNIHKP